MLKALHMNWSIPKRRNSPICKRRGLTSNPSLAHYQWLLGWCVGVCNKLISVAKPQNPVVQASSYLASKQQSITDFFKMWSKELTFSLYGTFNTVDCTHAIKAQ